MGVQLIVCPEHSFSVYLYLYIIYTICYISAGSHVNKYKYTEKQTAFLTTFCIQMHYAPNKYNKIFPSLYETIQIKPKYSRYFSSVCPIRSNRNVSYALLRNKTSSSLYGINPQLWDIRVAMFS
ncbi:hypothetical protein XENTR_v10004137 [Xenopus tropicalis]|nr:hypothetical protein XENTR_v10004137 [Xenopus tropicalis]